MEPNQNKKGIGKGGAFQKLLRYPLLIIFTLFIVSFAVADLLTPAKGFSEMENRVLTQRPKITWRTLMDGSYTLKYEDYINDQFVGRDRWISIKAVGETVFFKQENNNIVFGRDGYMFEKLLSVDEGRVKENVSYMVRLSAAFPEADITVAVIPNAYAILTDKVPYGMPRYDQLQGIENIYDELAASVPGVTVLDASGVLAPHTGSYIYYRTDHHWTSYGAWLAYAGYMRQRGLEPVALESLTAHEVPGFLGTYYSKAKRLGAQADTITWYDIPVTGVEVRNEINGEWKIEGKATLHNLEQFGERDKYAALLHSNNGLTVITSEAPGGRILVFKDSYGNSFVPFLAASYSEVYMIDLRYFAGSVQDFIRENDFDEILLLYNFMSVAQDGNIRKLGS